MKTEKQIEARLRELEAQEVKYLAQAVQERKTGIPSRGIAFQEMAQLTTNNICLLEWVLEK